MYIGIDPGKTGAIAFVGEKVVVEDLPLDKERQINSSKLYNNIYQYYCSMEEPIEAIILENIHASPAMGVTSSFSFGQTFGRIEGALSMFENLPIIKVAPATWKATLALNNSAWSKAEKKKRSVQKAEEIFPELKDFLYGTRGGIKDGRAEALLLAEYGRRRGF